MAVSEDIIHPDYWPRPARERVRRAFNQLLWPAVAIGGFVVGSYVPRFRVIGIAVFFGALVWAWARGSKTKARRDPTRSNEESANRVAGGF